MDGTDTTLSEDKKRPAREPSRLRGTSVRHADTPAKVPPRDLGGALRSVYEITIGEDIPSEMLDLLGKLD